MHFKILDILLVLTLVYNVFSNLNNNTDVKVDTPKKYISSDWKFKDYLKKFRPKIVWDKIDKIRKMNGENISIDEQFDTMLEGIDETDELMRLKIADINTNVVSDNARRQYRPPGGLVNHTHDPFELRFRIFELMKHAIYQARNRMVIMQTMRANYRNSSLYKMGYLFSKTDTAVKTFGKVSHRAYKACSESRQKSLNNYPMINIMQAEERILDLWFDVELLSDLININDKVVKELYETTQMKLNDAWKFVERK